MGWTPDHLNLVDRTYGVRSRARRFRWEVLHGGRRLLRWFPPKWFVDPLAMVDICSPWEVAWVTRHMSQEFRGTGAIVELGPWLGDITLGMIRGLKHNHKVGDARIDSYDLFVFEDIEDRTVGLPFASELHDGDEFLSLFLDRLGADARRVRTHPGDVATESWDPERPIEFLFNDVSKTWELWNHVRSTFYRSLKPGSTVVEQDWVHTCTPWIHLWHHRYRSNFQPIEHVPHSGSVAFRVVRELPLEALVAEDFKSYDEPEVTEAFEWAASLVETRRQPNVRGAHVHLYTLFGDLDTASRLCVREIARGQVDSELISITVPALAARLAERSNRPSVD